MSNKNLSRSILKSLIPYGGYAFLLTSILLLFSFIYKQIISPRYLDYGLYYHALSMEEYMAVFLCSFIPLLFLPKAINRPSDVAIWILYLISYLSTIFIRFYVTDRSFTDTILFFFIMLLLLIITNFSRYHPFTLKFDDLLQKGVRNGKYISFVLFSLIVLYLVFLTKGSIRFDFSDVYERRLAAREVTLFLHGYIIAFSRSVLTVFSLYLFMVHKKTIFGIILLSSMVLIFSFDGTKTALLVPVLLGFFVLFIKLTSKKTWLFFIAIILLFLAAIAEFTLNHSSIINDYLVRRIFAIPGLLNSIYWDFFSINDKVLMTDSLGKILIEPRYEVPTPYIIGEILFPGKETNANTGVWLGAFAHFGIAGMIAVSALCGFLLGLIDSLTKEHFFILGSLICLYIGLNWTEQMIHTSMLSGGIFYLLICLFCYVHLPHFTLHFSHYNKA
jgi:hypothetical protein